MLEKLKYKNHMNEVLEFGKGGLYVNENDLRDFAWSVISKNDRISGFKKGIAKKTIPVILKCDTESEGPALKNKLFEVFEKDVLANKHGRFIIGDYYLRCFVTEIKKTDYLTFKGYVQFKLTVQTDFPAWVKETTFSFYGDSEGESAYLDFNYDFPIDYMNAISGGEINNSDFVATNFRMNIYGYVVNPTLSIGGHEYSVKTTVEAGEYLTIDSINKTVILTRSNGTTENCFNLRNKESYVFEKIPSGVNGIVINHNKLAFDITLLEERSEPKWT